MHVHCNESDSFSRAIVDSNLERESKKNILFFSFNCFFNFFMSVKMRKKIIEDSRIKQRHWHFSSSLSRCRSLSPSPAIRLSRWLLTFSYRRRRRRRARHRRRGKIDFWLSARTRLYGTPSFQTAPGGYIISACAALRVSSEKNFFTPISAQTSPENQFSRLFPIHLRSTSIHFIPFIFQTIQRTHVLLVFVS